MADIRDIKGRSEGIRKILKVTAAMQIVAATKLKRAEQAALDSRDYLRAAQELTAKLSAGEDKAAERIFRSRGEGQKTCLVAVCSDRGLCGSFNSAVFRKAEGLRLPVGSPVVPLGKKAMVYFRRRSLPEKKDGFRLVTVRQTEKGSSLRLGRNIADYLLNGFRAGEIDRVYMVYNRFKPHSLPQAITQKLLPLDDLSGEGREMAGKDGRGGAAPSLYLYEPQGEELVYAVLSEYLFAAIRTALLQSAAAEEMSRMLTMKYATDNGNELLGQLMLQYHKLRQANITREILEVVGG
ncbi:MAG: ATP synthase F1 subunit gamma [Candidatus Omnitrophota bacterium]